MSSSGSDEEITLPDRPPPPGPPFIIPTLPPAPPQQAQPPPIPPAPPIQSLPPPPLLKNSAWHYEENPRPSAWHYSESVSSVSTDTTLSSGHHMHKRRLGVNACDSSSDEECNDRVIILTLKNYICILYYTIYRYYVSTMFKYS